MLILNNLKRLWPIYLLAISIFFNYVQNLKNESLHSKVALLNVEINQYKTQSEQYNATILKWKADYEKQLKAKKTIEAEMNKEQRQSVINAQNTMQDIISDRCENAIAYGIIKSQHLSGR